MSKNNLIGQKFGRLTVLKDSNKRSKNGSIYWTCQCDCGNIKDILGTQLISGQTKSCGCIRKEKASNHLVGQHIGRITVLKDLNQLNNDHRKIYFCKCDCGNYINLNSHYLLNSIEPSCGCYQIEKSRQNGQNSKKNLIGQRFGKLLVLRETNERTENGMAIWECLCDCGKITKICSSNLIGKKILSCGCTKQSHGELLIEQILIENNINFESEYIDKNCKLSTGGYARFDFKVNNYFIEFDGIQHFEATNRQWNTQEHLKETQKRDKEKNQYCLNNNIPLIRIPYTHLKELCLNDLLLETSNFIYQET